VVQQICANHLLSSFFQNNPNDPLAKRRADFMREASTLYNNKVSK
jgi:ubiquitin-protein ligase